MAHVSERTIVITGSSDGVGAAAARRLAAAGDNVVVIGRSVSKTKAIADELGTDYLCADYTRTVPVFHECCIATGRRTPRFHLSHSVSHFLQSATMVAPT